MGQAGPGEGLRVGRLATGRVSRWDSEPHFSFLIRLRGLALSYPVLSLSSVLRGYRCGHWAGSVYAAALDLFLHIYAHVDIAVITAAVRSHVRRMCAPRRKQGGGLCGAVALGVPTVKLRVRDVFGNRAREEILSLLKSQPASCPAFQGSGI